MNAVIEFELTMTQLRDHFRTCDLRHDEGFIDPCMICDAFMLLVKVQSMQLSASELPLMAALVQKLGGEVVITDEELMSVHGMVLYNHDMSAAQTTLSIRPKEETQNHTGEGSEA